MELAKIDELLQRYSAGERRIAANLHDLELNTTYQILTTDTLRGVTGERLNRWLTATPSLWEMFNLLSSTLDTARQLRGTGGRIKADVRRQLGEILTGPSIVFDMSHTPFVNRDLLAESSSELRISIETLLGRMRQAYEPIRDGVADVDDVLRVVLPRLDAAAATLARAETDAQTLRVRVPELDVVAARLSDVRTRAMDDPLSIGRSAGDELESLVRSAASKIATMRQSRDELQTDLAATSDLLSEIRDLRARAEASRIKSLETIVAPLGLAMVPSIQAVDGENGLASRLDPILDATGAWQNVRAELDVWLTQARRLRDQLARAEAANRAPLELRGELRGRLTAYRAKMAGTGRAEDMVLSEIADEAHNELYTAPTNVGRAAAIIAELGRQLQPNQGS